MDLGGNRFLLRFYRRLTICNGDKRKRRKERREKKGLLPCTSSKRYDPNEFWNETKGGEKRRKSMAKSPNRQSIEKQIPITKARITFENKEYVQISVQISPPRQQRSRKHRIFLLQVYYRLSKKSCKTYLSLRPLPVIVLVIADSGPIDSRTRHEE